MMRDNMAGEYSSSDDQEVLQSPKRLLPILVLFPLVIATLVVGYFEGGTQPVTTKLGTVQYPVGTRSSKEPSGYGPPSAVALPGYTRSYVDDFNSKGLPKGWLVFKGVPGGDPGGQFGTKHISVKNGELVLATYRDSAYKNRWVTGGMCQCGLSMTYGAYFVRSRVTGVGPNEVQLLWPANNQWPPEIDFNETPSAHETSATVHWSYANYIKQRFIKGINMSSWHTWGVIWTKKKIVYILDGRMWGEITNEQEIPHLPMNLDLEQRTECSLHAQCPKVPVQMQVDWIAEYHAK